MTELNNLASKCSILALHKVFFHTSFPLKIYFSSYPLHENFPEFAKERDRTVISFKFWWGLHTFSTRRLWQEDTGNLLFIIITHPLSIIRYSELLMTCAGNVQKKIANTAWKWVEWVFFLRWLFRRIAMRSSP